VTKQKLINLLFYPLIVCGSLVILRKGSAYKSFRQLAYKKMYKWQWRVLDKLMRHKEATK